METYEINISSLGDKPFGVIRKSDGAFIPPDLANSDYQVYLKSLNN